MKNLSVNNVGIPAVIENVTKWHYDRDLIEGSTDKAQSSKLFEEFFELLLSLAEGKTPIDDIGDMLVVLINIAERNGLTIEQCLSHAYSQIKNRTGKKINGVFVKDE